MDYGCIYSGCVEYRGFGIRLDRMDCSIYHYTPYTTPPNKAEITISIIGEGFLLSTDLFVFSFASYVAQ